jgi:hypothetical protein
MRLTVLVSYSCSTEGMPADVLVISAIVATFNTFYGLNIIRRSLVAPMNGVYQPVLGILCLMNCAQLFHLAWTGNFGRENMTVGNDDDDDTTN